MIIFLYQHVFDIPQTIRFFSHLDSFKPSSVTLTFEASTFTYISFPSNMTHHFAFPLSNVWKMTSRDSNSQVVDVAQICRQIPPFHSGVKSLTIKCDRYFDLDHPMQWLQLFHSFPSVQSLQIPVKLEPSIASALDRPTEESLAATEVFPSLHSISIVENRLGKTVQLEQPIQSFVADRQRSGRPISVSRTD
jgi:hypothetical protein